MNEIVSQSIIILDICEDVEVEVTDLHGDGGGGGGHEKGGEGQSEHLESSREKNALIELRRRAAASVSVGGQVNREGGRGACYVCGLAFCS